MHWSGGMGSTVGLASRIWRSGPLNGAVQRGLMWWENGDDRRVYFSAGKDLYALNAADGSLVEEFGDGGKLDMTPQDAEGGYIAVTVPGVVFEDKLIMGFSTTEDDNSYPGSIRAFSAVDGSLVWKFATIPAPNVALGGVLDTARLNEIATPCEISFHDAFEAICRDRRQAR